MHLPQLYDEAYHRYRHFPPEQLLEQVERESRRALLWTTESKDRFLAERPWRGLRVLESGGGLGGLSLHLARLGAQVTLVDVAPTALEVAQLLAQRAGASLRTECVDLGRPVETSLGQFDLIVDAHLLHCLPTVPERASYHQFVKEHLAPGGIVVGETMAHRKKIFVPEGWRLDEQNVLWQRFADWVPVRKIVDSLDLEVEFQHAGFHISYFYYYANYGIAPSAEYWDIPADVLPAAVRYVLTRP